MSVAKFNSKDYASYCPWTEDEKTLEKRYHDSKLMYQKNFADGSGFKYDKNDKLKDGRITTKHIYSVNEQGYWVDTDNKGGRKYVFASKIKK